jgi:hypothetical protein
VVCDLPVVVSPVVVESRWSPRKEGVGHPLGRNRRFSNHVKRHSMARITKVRTREAMARDETISEQRQ